MRDPRCGTPKGWYAHKRARQLPCKPCADAYTTETRTTGRIRTAAVRRLTIEYSRRYNQLLAEERKRALHGMGQVL